jgi:hypothetical protein
MAQFYDAGNSRPPKPTPLPSPYKPGTPTQVLFGTTMPALPKAKPPAPTTMPSTPTYSGGGYSGGSGGVGISSSGQVSNVAPAPIPSINQFLGADAGYQSQLAAIQKALADYQAQMGTQTNQYETNYASNLNQLGQDRTLGLADQQNDYTGRGLLHSGLYGKAAGDLTTQYDTKQADLGRARSDFLANLGLDFNNFKSQQDITGQRAKQDAIARRAAQYGVLA